MKFKERLAHSLDRHSALDDVAEDLISKQFIKMETKKNRVLLLFGYFTANAWFFGHIAAFGYYHKIGVNYLEFASLNTGLDFAVFNSIAFLIVGAILFLVLMAPFNLVTIMCFLRTKTDSWVDVFDGFGRVKEQTFLAFILIVAMDVGLLWWGVIKDHKLPESGYLVNYQGEDRCFGFMGTLGEYQVFLSSESKPILMQRNPMMVGCEIKKAATK